jgi:hypothetical protein
MKSDSSLPLLHYQQKQTPNKKKLTFSKQKENFQSCVTHLFVEALRMFLAMVFSTLVLTTGSELTPTTPATVLTWFGAKGKTW